MVELVLSGKRPPVTRASRVRSGKQIAAAQRCVCGPFQDQLAVQYSTAQCSLFLDTHWPDLGLWLGAPAHALLCFALLWSTPTSAVPYGAAEVLNRSVRVTQKRYVTALEAEAEAEQTPTNTHTYTRTATKTKTQSAGLCPVTPVARFGRRAAHE